MGWFLKRGVGTVDGLKNAHFPSPAHHRDNCNNITILKGSMCLRVIVPEAACCLFGVDYRLFSRNSGFRIWVLIWGYGEFILHGLLICLDFDRDAYRSVGRLGIGPGESHSSTQASNSRSYTLRKIAFWGKFSVVPKREAELCIARCKLLTNCEFEAMLGDC